MMSTMYYNGKIVVTGNTINIIDENYYSTDSRSGLTRNTTQTATITSTTRNPKPQITKSKEQMRRDALRNLPGNRKAMRY